MKRAKLRFLQDLADVLHVCHFPFITALSYTFHRHLFIDIIFLHILRLNEVIISDMNVFRRAQRSCIVLFFLSQRNSHYFYTPVYKMCLRVFFRMQVYNCANEKIRPLDTFALFCKRDFARNEGSLRLENLENPPSCGDEEKKSMSSRSF